MIEYRFPQRTVLVTGSSRGIGAAILEAFARAGARCVLHYFADEAGQNRVDAQAIADRYPGQVRCLAADVRSLSEMQALMQQVKTEFGTLDVVVNNAGILRDKSLRKMDEADWHDVIETNLDGVFYTLKSACDILADGGRIINIASISAYAGFHGQVNYAAAKAGVIGMTKVLAKELARRGITVNAVAPGMIRTGMLDAMKPEVLDEYIRLIPVGRLGKPEDVANAVLFLASEESSYITGQVIPISGGWF